MQRGATNRRCIRIGGPNCPQPSVSVQRPTYPSEYRRIGCYSFGGSFMSPFCSWLLHPISAGVSIILVGVFALVNVYPRVGWDLNYSLLDDDFVHGWPLVYMRRDCQIAYADMGGMYHSPWPFIGTSPIRQFRIFALLFNVCAAATLIALTISPIDLFLHVRHVRFRFSLLFMITCIGLLCILLAILLAIDRRFPIFLFALHCLPNYIVHLSFVFVCLSIANQIRRLCGPMYRSIMTSPNNRLNRS
jgi:hypothetical protein